MGDNFPPFRNIVVENPVEPEVIVNNIVQLDGNVSLCESNSETESISETDSNNGQSDNQRNDRIVTVQSKQ